MGKVIELPDIDLAEPIAVPLTYADGVGIAHIGSNLVQIVFYADHVASDRQVDHRIVARIAIPMEPLKNNMSLIAQAVLGELGQRMQAKPTHPEIEDQMVM